MRGRFLLACAALLALAFPLASGAAVNPSDLIANPPSNCRAPRNASSQCTASAPCSAANEKITYYVPHGGSNCHASIEGCVETSMKNLNGYCTPVTLDAVRLERAPYATCASDPSNYGKYFNIGAVAYRSALDMQMHTVQNVVCYVHDTGSAFRGRPDKLDLATTVCGSCTDAEAGWIGVGGKVNLTGSGAPYVPFVSAGLIGSGFLGSSAFSSYQGGSAYYCVASIKPVVVIPVTVVPGQTFTSWPCYNAPPPQYAQQYSSSPFGNVMPASPSYFPSQGGAASPGVSAAPAYNSASQIPAASSQQQLQPSLAQQLISALEGNAAPPPASSASSTAAVPAAATLVAQPSAVAPGDPIVVSWSSVGTSETHPCAVSQNGSVIAQKNEGSAIVRAAAGATFTLSCTSQAGASVQKTASVSIF